MMITVSELRTMTVEQSAEMVLKDLELRILVARHMPGYPNPKLHIVDIPWGYTDDITNVVIWKLLESGYDVKLYHVDGGLNIHIAFYV